MKSITALSAATFAGQAVMNKHTGTYGKAWHTWDTERDDLPLGTPEPMTAGGELRCALREDRDLRFDISGRDGRG